MENYLFLICHCITSFARDIALASKKERMSDMALSTMSLFDVDTYKIDETTPLSKIKDMINNALNTGSINEFLIQGVIDWCQENELRILSATPIPVVYRYLKFTGFNKAIKYYGVCTTCGDTGSKATIGLSKRLRVHDNADGIINVIAHEVLHGVLPNRVRHGNEFVSAMNILNERMGVQMVVRGLVGKCEQAYKFELYCPHCQIIFDRYTRRCKTTENPSRYACGKCGTSLKCRPVG